jgi:D-glycero-alpha-D-manno-heptose-7-phosphate kinase
MQTLRITEDRTPAKAPENTLYHSRAPLRISFCGGGTDIPEYYNRYNGVVLSTTIDKYVHVTVKPRADRKIIIVSYDYDIETEYTPGHPRSVPDKLRLAMSIIDEYELKTGIEVYIHTDVPPNSGLGTSTSFTVALLGALEYYTENSLLPRQLAEKAYYIERKKERMAGGKQDQYAAAFGGFNIIEFCKSGIKVIPLGIASDTINMLRHHLIICYTNSKHDSGDLSNKLIGLINSGNRSTIQSSQRLQTTTYEMREALERGDLKRFGELMYYSGQLKKAANPHTMNGLINNLYEDAMQNGAVGGKILGAGAGGFLLLFCKCLARHKLLRRLESLGCRQFNFNLESEGLQVWKNTII